MIQLFNKKNLPRTIFIFIVIGLSFCLPLLIGSYIDTLPKKESNLKDIKILNTIVDNYIKDNKIYKIGLGDNLTDHYSINEIIINQRDYYKNTNFIISDFSNINHKVYDSISVGYNKNDDDYIVQFVSGNVFYQTNIENCYGGKDIITRLFSDFFEISGWNNNKWKDEDGNYNFDQTNIIFTNNNKVLSTIFQIGCVDWNNGVNKNIGWTDKLTTSLSSKEWEEMLLEQKFKVIYDIF